MSILLAINFNGSDGSTDDYTAETGQTVSFEGTAQLDTEQKKFGDSSLLLDGDSDYVHIPDSDYLDIFSSTSSNWTMDFWVYYSTLSGTDYLVTHYEDKSNYWALFYATTSGFCIGSKFGGNNYNQLNQGAYTLSTSTWHHIALIKVNNAVALYLDGTRIANLASLTNTYTLNGNLNIGTFNGSGNFTGAWIDSFRISDSNIFNANPTSTDNITVPTSQYSNINVTNQVIII